MKFSLFSARTVAAFCAAAGFLSAPGSAGAREPDARAPAIETGDTLTGNYLAAILAGASSDTQAASTYFREVLRRDPRNIEVAGRAFVAALSNGDMEDAFRIAEAIVKRESGNGLARLALAVRSIKQGQYATARTHLSRAKMNQANDVTGTLPVWAGLLAPQGKALFDFIVWADGDDLLPEPVRAACAKQVASANALQCAAIAHAVHGAIGVTEEYDLQLFTRRLRAWAAEWGGAHHWAAVLGRGLLAGGRASVWHAVIDASAGSLADPAAEPTSGRTD